MSIDPQTLNRLAAEAVADPLGGVHAATYDTAQLVLAAAHRPDRLDDKLRQAGLDLLSGSQQADGGWGARCWPYRYRLVPSLAAVAATAIGGGRAHIPVLRRGLDYLAARPELSDPGSQPDLMAVEYIVPALLEQLCRATVTGRPGAAIDDLPLRVRQVWRDRFSAALAAWAPHRDRLAALRRALVDGTPVPVQLAHSAELAAGEGSGIAALSTPLPIGCSAAATAAFAAWAPTPQPDAVEILVRQAERLSGGLPVIMAMTTFEVQTILGFAVRAQAPLPASARETWLNWLTGVLEPTGVRGGPGLPPDGDDTAVILYLLQQFGQRTEPLCLLDYMTTDGCASYPGERTRSITTAAHALEAVGRWLEIGPGSAPKYRQARRILLDRLLEMQTAEGHWEDKWHSSPHYATNCVVTALAGFGGDEARPAIERAGNWLREAQLPDGSWGRWTATLEETALAVLTLRRIVPQSEPALRSAIEFLDQNRGAPIGSDLRTPLWQGKELYEPRRIVEATVFAALSVGP